jgi:hypothetical protein
LPLLLVVALNAFGGDDFYCQIGRPIDEAELDLRLSLAGDERDVGFRAVAVVESKGDARAVDLSELLLFDKVIDDREQPDKEIVGLRILGRRYVNDSVQQVRFLTVLYEKAELGRTKRAPGSA